MLKEGYKLEFQLNEKEHPKDCPISRRLQLFSSSFSSAVVGGVFDHLHLGHKSLIQTAFQFANKVHLTIMGDQWIKEREKEYFNDIESFTERLKSLKEFLDEFDLSQRSKLKEISDPFNYALQGRSARKLDVLVVSKEKGPKKRAQHLNKLRGEKNLPPLTLLKIPLLRSSSGDVFSSTEIRREKTNQFNKEIKFKGGTLTERVKPKLRKTKGKVATSITDLPPPTKYIISIGDQVTRSLIKEGYPISIGVIDGKVRRKRINSLRIILRKKDDQLEVPPYLPCRNPPGNVTKNAWIALKVALLQETPTIVNVHGEEDLMGLLATVLAPKRSLILYGQPPSIGEEGIVHFRVTQDRRNEAISLLKQMNAF